MRRFRDRQPTGLFRGNELARLMSMIVMLGVLAMMVRRARDADTWRFLTGEPVSQQQDAGGASKPLKPRAHARDAARQTGSVVVSAPESEVELNLPLDTKPPQAITASAAPVAAATADESTPATDELPATAPASTSSTASTSSPAPTADTAATSNTVERAPLELAAAPDAAAPSDAEAPGSAAAPSSAAALDSGAGPTDTTGGETSPSDPAAADQDNALPTPDRPAVAKRPIDDNPEEQAALETEAEAVADRRPIAPEEMFTYYRLLRWTDAQSAEQMLGRAQRDVRWGQLLEDPSRFRGKLLEVKLHVRRVLKEEAPPDNPLKLKEYYQAVGWNKDSDPHFYHCVFQQLPAEMPVGELVYAEGRFVGYFFKIITYLDSQGRTNESPVLVGRMIYEPPPAELDPPAENLFARIKNALNSAADGQSNSSEPPTVAGAPAAATTENENAASGAVAAGDAPQVVAAGSAPSQASPTIGAAPNSAAAVDKSAQQNATEEDKSPADKPTVSGSSDTAQGKDVPAADPQAADATADKPAFKPLDRPNLPANPEKYLDPSSEPEKPVIETGPLDEDPEERQAFDHEVEAISDRTPIGPEEMFAYWRLLRWAHSQTTEEMLKRARSDVRFDGLLNRPDEFRGELIKVKLHIRRVLEETDPPADNPLHLTHYYQAVGWNDASQAWFYHCVFEDLPEGMKVGEIVYEEGTFVGYFFKDMVYFDGKGTKIKSPVLIGRMIYHPTPSIAKNPNEWMWSFAIGGVLILLFAARWGLRFYRPGKAAGRLGAASQRPALNEAGELTVPLEDWLDQAESPGPVAEIKTPDNHDQNGSTNGNGHSLHPGRGLDWTEDGER